MDMIRLGIIGIGNIGTTHVTRATSGECPDIRLVAVADRRESRRQWAAEHIPDVRVFSDGAELIESRVCDAVLISVPHYQHPDLAILAMRYGQHVLVEKPAGVYTLQVREMIIEADKHPDLTFALMFNQRTNCLYRKMKEMITSGELGEMKRMSWLITDWYRPQYYYDSGAWRATWSGEGGGVLLNQCPHQLDLLQWLCGMPVKVQAHMFNGKWHDIEVEDDVTAYLEFANGATGVFVTTTADAPGTNRLEITGTKGKLVCENGRLTFWKLEIDEREYCSTSREAFGKPPCTVIEVETDGTNPQHTGVLNAFAANILRGEPLVADGREGINGLMLSNAMHLSSWLDSAVTLPIDEKLFYDLLMERFRSSRRKPDADITSDTEGSY